MGAIGEFSADRVRGHRNGLGLTRPQVAAHIGRKVDTVTSYELGVNQPGATVLARLAALFGVQVDDLYARHEDPFEDYVDAVCSHMPPLDDDAIKAVAAVLRRIDGRRARSPVRSMPNPSPSVAI